MVPADRAATACPYCGSEALGGSSGLRPEAGTPWGAEGGWTAVRCRACRFVYLNPRPHAEAIGEAAKLGQHAVEAGILDVVGAFSDKKVDGLRDRLRDVWADGTAPWTRRDSSWLDVGAGFGELVKAVADLSAGAGRVVGIEPCQPKVDAARRLGLEVAAKGLAQAREEGPWDVVSLVNVFSHLPDVHGFFAEIATLVRPGGEILVVTGNGADIERSDYPQPLSLPDHVVFGGEAHVVGVLERAGFRLQALRRFETALPRPGWEAKAEHLAATVLRRRVGYSGTPFRSLWMRARRA